MPFVQGVDFALSGCECSSMRFNIVILEVRTNGTVWHYVMAFFMYGCIRNGMENEMETANLLLSKSVGANIFGSVTRNPCLVTGKWCASFKGRVFVATSKVGVKEGPRGQVS